MTTQLCSSTTSGIVSETNLFRTKSALGDFASLVIGVVFGSRNDDFVSWENRSAATEAVDTLQLGHGGEEITSKGVEIVPLRDRVVSIRLAGEEHLIVVLKGTRLFLLRCRSGRGSRGVLRNSLGGRNLQGLTKADRIGAQSIG